MMTEQRPTLREVAAHAGVSVATASLVLNGRTASKGRAREETQERVVAAAAELGYERNQIARGLRRGRTEQVSVVVGTPHTPWGQTLTADVARVAEMHGYATVMFIGGDWRMYLRRGAVDGAIIDKGHDVAADLKSLRPSIERGLALVVLNNQLEPDGFDVVRANEAQACDDAVRLLVEQGRRRIGCLRYAGTRPDGLDDLRFHSYRTVLHECGLTAEDAWVRDVYDSRERAYTATLDLLQRDRRPDAIFALSDFAAISALWAAHRLGIMVPDDLAIIGVGNSTEGNFTSPPLTTVGPYRLDFTAVASMLFDRLVADVQPSGRVHWQPWELIRRGTA